MERGHNGGQRLEKSFNRMYSGSLKRQNCVLLEGGFCTSPKFPMEVTSINTLHSSSQTENSPWHTNPLLYLLGKMLTSSWPLLPSA